MIEKGQEVSIESGMFEGKRGRVTEVDRSTRLATVAVEAFGDERETRVPMDELRPVSDDPEELMERIVERVKETVEKPAEVRRNLWWARRAAEGAEAGRELLEEFREFRDALEEELEETLQERIDELHERLGHADIGELRAWLGQRREALEEEWREEIAQLQEAFLEEVVPAEQLQEYKDEAMKSGSEDEEAFLDEEGAVRQAVDRLTSSLVDEGLGLWERARQAVALEDFDGYRWETIQPGPVELAVEPPEEDRRELDLEVERLGMAEVPAELQEADGAAWREAFDAEIATVLRGERAWLGLTTREGVVEAFDENPWNVPEEPTVEQVIDWVWGPLESRTPNVVERLRRQCLAVAQVQTDEGVYLVYLVERQELQGRNAIVGGPPEKAMQAELADGEAFDLPMGARELFVRHRSVCDGHYSVETFFERLSGYVQGEEERGSFREQNDGAEPERFVAFSGDDLGNCDVFDLDELDDRNDPKVASWDHETRSVGFRQPFWKYMGRLLSEMLL